MNILLTSAGRRTYIIEYFKIALKGIGKVHAANSEFTYSLKTADQAVITPLIYDQGYVDFLIKYCTENKISVILSLFDIDLPVLAKNIDKFKHYGIKVIVSDYNTIILCNDKWLTFQFLKENNFFTPMTYNTLNDCIVGLKKREVKFPLIIKPRWGMGSIGIFQAEDIIELEVLYRKTKKSIFNSYLKFESRFDSERAIIIQEKISGQEIDLDAFNDLDGNNLGGVPMEILAMRAGESDKVKIIHDNTLVEIGRKISSLLNLVSCWNLDTIKYKGEYYILEINCRFNGLSPFSYLAGTNFPQALVNILMRKDLSKELFEFDTEMIGIKDLKPIRF